MRGVRSSWDTLRTKSFFILARFFTSVRSWRVTTTPSCAGRKEARQRMLFSPDPTSAIRLFFSSCTRRTRSTNGVILNTSQ
ncbi:MAG: Ada metal-binding domain-containing protein [Acidobacteriota bacterium]